MDFTYQLKEETGFKGIIVVSIPSRMERLKMLQDIRFSLGSDGKAQLSSDHMEFAIKQQKMVEDHVKKVDIEVVSTGQKVYDLKDLDVFSEFNLIVNEISEILINGISLGKHLPKA